LTEDEAAEYINMLILMTIPLQIITALFVGYIFDLVGRRIAILVTMIIQSCSAFLTPYTAPTIYPTYFLVRSLTEMMYIVHACNPLINDYIKAESRGLARSF
jgi:hypothetical protein